MNHVFQRSLTRSGSSSSRYDFAHLASLPGSCCLVLNIDPHSHFMQISYLFFSTRYECLLGLYLFKYSSNLDAAFEISSQLSPRPHVRKIA